MLVRGAEANYALLLLLHMHCVPSKLTAMSSTESPPLYVIRGQSLTICCLCTTVLRSCRKCGGPVPSNKSEYTSAMATAEVVCGGPQTMHCYNAAGMISGQVSTNFLVS